jgi:hypothetical protein
VAAQIHGPVVSVVAIVLIIVGIVVWERWWLRRPRPQPRSGTPPDDDLPAY